MKLTLLSTAATAVTLLTTGCVVESYNPPPPHGQVSYEPGYVINTLPSGYRTEVISGTRYYSHDNVYYRPQGRGYVVVRSPRGGGGNYGHESDHNRNHDGRDRDGDGRDHDGNGNGHGHTTVIRSLPHGYVVVNRGGHRYYRAGNVYYESQSGGYVEVREPF
jgi:hypothetical protein